MIRDIEKWRAWEDAYRASRLPDPPRAFKLAEAMYNEARALGVWNEPFTLERIAHKIRLARILNVRRAP
jgi:hypothetical protein